ncbi:rlpA-like lipoprotein [Candidatus Photodesmus blepharus]|uniref:Endolytic peptidoglycan transglycosylase RlpA n=1 Tax=Candidatus Photodesmus blepharonis TaxID=1179155 RepID=A0A084CPJ0_9GAMM|nr:septal ring lytic transglycosylase RlpA family protein [Candidatus Photodesmus blepharus]KEY91719.1 rlpA-like lipoprotein [Candidatus Photodesmus blepharus]
MKKQHFLFIIGSTIILTSCCSSVSRYNVKHDSAPQKIIPVANTKDATPRYEPYSLGGNQNYTLHGNDYVIVESVQGFKEKGKASWYGKKFHGHLTANGEIYDMYSMSAAHKTLPIPIYVKIINTDNNKVAVVRVNDRGPFHDNRIIDLSYAAARKLDIIGPGTANVAIEVITVSKASEGNQNAFNYAVQVASLESIDRSQVLVKDLNKKLSVNVFVNSQNKIHQVLLGPFSDLTLAKKKLKKAKLLGYNSSFVRMIQ